MTDTAPTVTDPGRRDRTRTPAAKAEAIRRRTARAAKYGRAGTAYPAHR